MHPPAHLGYEPLTTNTLTLLLNRAGVQACLMDVSSFWVPSSIKTVGLSAVNPCVCGSYLGCGRSCEVTCSRRSVIIIATFLDLTLIDSSAVIGGKLTGRWHSPQFPRIFHLLRTCFAFLKESVGELSRVTANGDVILAKEQKHIVLFIGIGSDPRIV